jgi:hypothetical protein
MTNIWTKAENIAEFIENKFAESGTVCNSYDLENYGWYNKIYTSSVYRRAHLEVVDKRFTHKMYIVHATIFPHYNNSSPIWGFDIVCGQNKITGAFLDYSSCGNANNEMNNWFNLYSDKLQWNKPRELPNWAKQIFSPGMIAAGNIQDDNELKLLETSVVDSLNYYLTNVGNYTYSGADYKSAQNRYCYWQKQNPRVISSMVAMGETEQNITNFVNTVLFPEE